MKKRVFLLNTLLLTGASLLARSLSLGFRVFVSNKIGAEGIGLYQLICTVFFFAVTFSTAGISLSVTRLVTDALARGHSSYLRNILKKSLFLSLSLSLSAAAVLFFCSEQIALFFLHDVRAACPLRILAPGLPFMAVSSCFRGYFIAVRKVMGSVSEQLFEQVVSILVTLLLMDRFVPFGVEYACRAVVIGNTVSELCSCAFSFLLYLYQRRKERCSPQNQRGSMRKIIGITLPVTVSSCLRSGLSTLENILIPQGLRKSGISQERSLAGYGMLSGMVMPILFFPSAFLSAFTTLIVPELSEANAIHHKKNISYIVGRVLQLTSLFSILVMGIFFFFPGELSLAVYHSAEAGIYLRMLALLVPLMYLDSVVDGMLKGLGQQLYSMGYNIMDSFLRVIAIYFLIPSMGIHGCIVVFYASEIFNFSLSLGRLIKVTELHINLKGWVLKPFLCAALPGFSLGKLLPRLSAYLPSAPLRTALGIILTALFYFALLRISGSFTREDTVWIKEILLSGRKKPPLSSQRTAAPSAG